MWDLKKRFSVVFAIWLWMWWWFFIQPVCIPVTAMIPIFMFPMAGVIKSEDVGKCYFNDMIALFIIGGMLNLLLNNSGVDRRIALHLICSGDSCQFSGKRLVFKCSTAAFFLSMFSNRLIVSSFLMQYVTPAFNSLKSYTSRSTTEPSYDEMRNIVCNAIQTSCTIGSTVFLHGAIATLAFKAMWLHATPDNMDYEDIFNYLQFTCFMFPVAFLMFILNMCYYMLLINLVTKKGMSGSSLAEMKRNIIKHKQDLPKRHLHETLSVIFLLLALAALHFRWSNWLPNMGWAGFQNYPTAPKIPVIKDATVAAIFVFALHILPKGINFVKIWAADKKSKLPPPKPESAILWWRFIDKNTNYGYIFLLGAGSAIIMAAIESKLDSNIKTDGSGKFFTAKSVCPAGLFLIVFICAILSNIISGVAVTVVTFPFVVLMAPQDSLWEKDIWRAALGVGIATSYGFMTPFMYTCAYFCHHTGEVRIKKMIMYAVVSVVLCSFILWLALCFWAPVIWPGSIMPVTAPIRPGTTSTEAAGGGGDAATTAAPPPPP